MDTDSKNIRNYLILGIVATVFCCPPLGALSLIYAGKIEKYAALDNPAKAMMAAEKSKFWGVAAILVGLALGVCTALYSLIF